MNLRPLGARITVTPVEEPEKTTGGVFLPQTAADKPLTGKVIRVGKRITEEVVLGDLVKFKKYAGSEVPLEGVTYIVLEEKDIIAVVEA